MALVVGVAGITACAAAPAAPVRDEGWLTGRLTAAVSAKDQQAFDALFRGEENAGIRHWIWLNLLTLPQIDFGTDGNTLTADWRIGPDMMNITSRVGQVACGVSDGCAVTDMGPQTGVPAPIWAVQPLAVTGSRPVIVLGAPDDASAPDWLAAAQAARQAITGAGLSDLAVAWDGNLVVELPQDAGAMAHLLGQPSIAGYTTTGALTWIERPPSTSSITSSEVGYVAHIIVNPMTTASLTPAQKTLLLTHEAVHVATVARPVAPGASWVTEGLAESIAVAASPDDVAAETSQAKATCTAAGLTPPADGDFGGTDAAAQTVAYATSQVLVGLIRTHLGASAMDAIALLWQGQDAPGVDLEAWSKTWCEG